MRGISLPINAIVYIALGLLVLVVMAAIFIRGGGGFVRTTGQQADYQQCQQMCSNINTWAMSLNAEDINGTTQSQSAILDSFVKNCINKSIMTNCTFTSADGYNCYIYNKSGTYEFRCK